jgi:hypothetical protein
MRYGLLILFALASPVAADAPPSRVDRSSTQYRITNFIEYQESIDDDGPSYEIPMKPVWETKTYPNPVFLLLVLLFVIVGVRRIRARRARAG